MSKKILCILGHPNPDSFNGALFNYYIQEASQNNEVKGIAIANLKFDPILHKGYKEIQELEPDLKNAQELIKWADHLVFFYPYWWGSFPAQFKGFIDRIFMPGFGFKFDKTKEWKWDKLLKGKTARLIVTTGAPAIYINLFMPHGINVMKKGILEFCGIKTKVTLLGPIKQLTQYEFDNALNKIKILAKDTN